MIKNGRCELSRNSQIWTLTIKNIELYFKKGPVIIFGLLFPFFMMLAWIIGRGIHLYQLFSGIMAMAIFFLSTSISPVIFPWETHEKNLERMVAAPITLFDLIFSIIFASTLFSLFLSTILFVILMVIFGIPAWCFISFILGAVLLSWASSSLGVLISAPPTDITANIMLLSTLVKFPLIFISGIFVPLEILPLPVFVLALFSPITYFVDILKSSLGIGTLGIGLDLLVLLIWAIMFHVLAYLFHKKTFLMRF
ncbi:MAG: ABC transporter permease [Candidatus Helarchaeales archaeon]